MTVKQAFETLEYGPAPESAGLANEWLDEHGRKFGVYVNGEWILTKETFATHAPATGKEIAQVSQAGADIVDKAVAAAKAALPKWQALGGTGRAKVLYALARIIQRHSRLLAVVESMDNGKPIRESRDLDIPLVARHFYHHAGWAQLLEEEYPDYEAVGVCGQIIPWNFPLLMLAWKIAPALAAGNTVVLKPAEFTPLTALLFAELCHAAGVPKGVVNIITGDGETGKHIVNHPDINKIAFTGSTEVGRIIRNATAGSGKKLSLELGGKSPFIVFEDADIDGAIEGLVDAIWFNQGQVCCAGSRLLVQESIAEKFLQRVKVRMDKLRVGDPLDKAVDIGAVIAPVQLERITELVNQGVAEGATLYQPANACPKDGWFYPPTLLSDVAPSATVAQVEIFGPVLVAMTFRTPDEAVALANNTAYGLAASVWTENLNVAHDISARVKAGTVWINCSNQFDAACGFGGYRESGYGREGGREGLFEYLKPIVKPGKPAKTATKKPATSAVSAGVDRTHKLYIGGKQARPDGGYSVSYSVASGGQIDVARGNRKDIRNAVQAAESASESWSASNPALKAQILYYLAENIEGARETFVKALTDLSSISEADAQHEVTATIERVMWWAAWADKYDGRVHPAPFRGFVSTRNESLGPVAIVAPQEPALLGLLSAIAPNVAMGNPVVVLPSEANPLPACELYRVIDASDVPSGVINIVTGPWSETLPTLADHEAVQSIWNFGGADWATEIERRSAANLKQTWCVNTVDWTGRPHPEFIRRATQIKNIWVPFGA